MDQNYYLNNRASSLSVSSLLNYIFMSTVNTAAKTLISVVGVANSSSNSSLYSDGDGNGDQYQRWKLIDHFRYMMMLMIWFTLWILRLLMDYFPCSLLFNNPPPPNYILDHEFSSSSSSYDELSSYSYSSSSSSLDLVLHEGFGNGYYDYDASSPTKAIDRALSHIFTLLNEIPATSRKYQFALTMADKILDDNLRVEHAALHKINRAALSSAFERTCNLLYRSLQSSSQLPLEETSNRTPWFFHALPLGSYIGKGLKFCLNSFLPSSFGGIASMLLDTSQSQKTKQLAKAGGNNNYNDFDYQCVMVVVAAEKLAQELLWITNKLRVCSAVDEALVQWSFATGLASLSLTSIPRVQGFIVKITVVLLGELARGEQLLEEAPRQVKFRLLLLWLPLLCYASNGVSYPVLTGFERIETERVIEEVISSLPASDQEVILTNWFQDFTSSNSDWPNLQRSYDQWCRSSRNLLLT